MANLGSVGNGFIAPHADVPSSAPSYPSTSNYQHANGFVAPHAVATASPPTYPPSSNLGNASGFIAPHAMRQSPEVVWPGSYVYPPKRVPNPLGDPLFTSE